MNLSASVSAKKYETVYVKGRGTVLKHRLVMEQLIGRELTPDEEVHHKDGDKSNNDPKNLELMPSRTEHAREHAWSREELLELLIRYNDIYGHWPSWSNAAEHSQMPHPNTFATHFGSWREAKKCAIEKVDVENHMWE